ncbi:MAG: hypothetical protein WCT02_02510 [Candidatus Paceibacterota bacterium]
MLYIFHGTDKEKSSQKARALADSLRMKRPDAAFVKVNPEELSVNLIEGHLGGQGLFSNKYIIFLDNPSENAEALDKLPDFLSAMNESDNIFIISEGKVKADLKKAYEKGAEKVVVTDLPVASGYGYGKAEAKSSGKKEFNIFSLADAIGSREAGRAWAIYREAIDNDLEPESIIGTLFWQVKSMILARDAKSATEAGLSPFVYSKAKKGAANYSAPELAELSRKLIEIYHDSHRGLVNGELATERLLLSSLRRNK